NFKGDGNLIYLIGETKNELGGSEFARIMDIEGVVPSVDSIIAKKVFEMVSKGIRKNLFLSVHDLSDGGLGVALAEMGFSNRIGCRISLSKLESDLREDILLFSESNSRFLVEIRKGKSSEFELLFKDLPIFQIGRTEGDSLIIDAEDEILIDLPIEELYKRWKEAVEW
ncbi:phosphoribosylformylglycinamidine synthase II, partial [candidate division WOR-3 bacterium]|nr:phosphoribosylformylglycinamidine synthase II [candidate division WOR-3 bacterium]